ncbi:hypothetical protein C2G38_2188795 [Gigaspora rosea]|uniref:Protein kinase domain-containing protein n=1 Tax=Gigaspora rosea TaxID=44941 RepID=A0A397V391_9GLOM|nr:hypothetical protein C2G38_2188795 [Gigaspora rosea]
MAQRCEYREWLDIAIRNNQIIKHDYNTFNDIIPVGHGSFGKVSSASSKFKSKVALKSIRINPDFTIELLVNELKQHIRIGSDNNILEFYGIIEKELNEFVLILEYANNGTLKEYLYNNFCVLSWDDKLCLAKQLTDAVKFLHSHDIIHRDLHSENVLIHDKIVKLSDFGNSKFIADPSIQLTKELGSIRYSDPEFLRSFPNYSRTKKSDIYSLGVLFWEISSGREPFKFEPLLRLLSRIISGLKEKPIHGTPKGYVDIYEECWKSIPDQRPTIEEVVFNIENVNLDNVISIEEIEVDDYVDNSQPDITSIIRGLTNGIDADSEHFHELYEALSLASNSASNSASNINKALNLSSYIDDISNSALSINEDFEISNSVSNINEALNLSSNINEASNSASNFDEEPILKIDSKSFEYIDNHIKDSDKQFLQQLVQLFFNYVNISEEHKLLVNKIEALIKESNKNSDKIFKKLLKHQGQPTFAHLIGFFYDHGIGIKVNKRKAQKMYEQAKKYKSNIQSQSNSTRSLNPIYRITKSTEAFAYNIFGNIYRNGDGITQSNEKAFQFYMKSAENGNHHAQYSVGYCYQYGIGTAKNEEKAFQWYVKSSANGNPKAQSRLGNCYQYGIGTTKDEQKAFQWYMKSAESGTYNSQNNLGYCYQNGVGVIKDEEKAFQWYTKSTENGNPKGPYNLGYCYQNGIGTIKDEQKAFRLYLMSAEKGYSFGQHSLGNCYQHGIGTAKNEEQAFRWHKKSANNGNPYGQNSLGYCYQYGIGTAINENEAFQWYKKSAENWCSCGQNNLGYCYQYGIGIAKDEQEAFRWYKRSAEQGDIDGQNNLKNCYENGIGTIRNEQEAIHWDMKTAEKEKQELFLCYMISARNGDPKGQNELGYCYQHGIGTVKNEQKAFQWYKKSAEEGNSDGQNNLGYCYENGIGTIKDEQMAFQWYTKSANGGNSSGILNLANCYENGIGTSENKQQASQLYTKIIIE